MMFFDTPESIQSIAKRSGASIFVLPDEQEIKIENAMVVQPEDKASITIDQIRGIIKRLNIKQTSDFFIIIKPAELMNIEAVNALLKNLEEPGENIHFILLTNSPSKLLPTVLSRCAVYFLKTEKKLKKISVKDEEIKNLAKRLLVAKNSELIEIAEEITKVKTNVRTRTLAVLGAAIEMLYKTYFITNKIAFAEKLPKFLEAYDSINQNGHIKLHLIADLC